MLHGEKVAYGILVQLRLEEMVQGNQLAASSRRQLLQFYTQIGLPKTLEDLGLTNISLAQLRQVTAIDLLILNPIFTRCRLASYQNIWLRTVSTTLCEINKQQTIG